MNNIMSVSDSMGRFIEVNIPVANNGDMELWMIGSIADKCIIRPYVSVSESTMTLKYDVTDCECLRNSLKTRSLSAGMIKKLIIGLNAASRVMSGHLMGEENLLLETDSIFVDRYDGEFRFCAFPLSEANISWKLEMLMRELLILTDPHDEEAVMLSASLLRSSCLGDCHIYDLMTVLANTAQMGSDSSMCEKVSSGSRLLHMTEDEPDPSDVYNDARVTDNMDYRTKTDVDYLDESDDTLYQGRGRKLKNGVLDSLNRGSMRGNGDSWNKRETGFGKLLNQSRKKENEPEDKFDQGQTNEDDKTGIGRSRAKRGTRADKADYKTRFGLKDLDDVSYDIDDILSVPGNGAKDGSAGGMENNGLYAAYASGSGARDGSAGSMENNGLYAAYANGSEKGVDMYGFGTGTTDMDMPDDEIKDAKQALKKKIVSRIIMSQCMMMAAMACIVLIKGMNSAVRALPIYAIMSVCTALYFAIELFTARKPA